MSGNFDRNDAAGCLSVAVALAVFVAIFVGIKACEEESWRKYASEHQCHITHTSRFTGFVGGRYSDVQQTCWACESGPLGVEVCR